MDHKLCVPCLLGLEGPIAEELRRMDMDGVSAENGRVFFSGGDEAIARANICLRIGERVLIELGRFEALSFEQLFQGTRGPSLGEPHPRRRGLPRQGLQPQLQTLLHFRLSENNKEGHCGKAQKRLRHRVVP